MNNKLNVSMCAKSMTHIEVQRRSRFSVTGERERGNVLWLKSFFLVMTLWVASMDVGWGQTCISENFFPPTDESMNECFFPGGTAVDLLTISDCPFFLNIDGTTISDATITFGGDLNLQFFSSLHFVRCTLLFVNNKGIELNQSFFPFPAPNLGASLRLTNCLLKSCGPIKWKGIRSTNFCNVIIEGSTIDNAKTGVGGGNVSISSSTISGCEIGVSAPENRFFNEVTFDGNDVGISIMGGSSTTISGCTFQNGSLGIKAVSIYNNGSVNFPFSITKKNDFLNLSTGIYLNDVNGFTIQNQIFKDCSLGINTQNSGVQRRRSNILLANNTFDVGDNAISLDNFYKRHINFNN